MSAKGAARSACWARNIHVTQGAVVFNGPIGNPQLAVTAEQQLEEGGTISVGVSGTVADMQVSLGGTSALAIRWVPKGPPALSPASTAAFGHRRFESEQQGQSRRPARRGQRRRRRAARGAGGRSGRLRHFQIPLGPGDVEDLFSGSLEVGTYVTDRLFVRVLQPVRTRQSGQEVSLEYRLLEWLKVRAQQSASRQLGPRSAVPVRLEISRYARSHPGTAVLLLVTAAFAEDGLVVTQDRDQRPALDQSRGW